ncbi:MAG: hypothetical protein HY331_11695 [Chloroflexi bacterium]|nr:hypothetical protein [Chloroflexota bacterium]
MPRTITIDDANLLRVSLARSMDGSSIHVEAVYQLLSGTTVVQTLSREMTTTLTAAQKAAMGAIFNQVLDAVKAVEL